MKSAQEQLVKTARITGIWYLLMAISGITGFMILHSQVYHADPHQTLTHLTEDEPTARLRLLMEFLIVVTQALAAVWFYRLFKDINEWAAWTVGVWGTVNSVVIMVSAIAMGAALKTGASAHMPEDKVLLIDLLTNLIRNAWAVGGLFFGLWLIPMGYIVTSSGRMPVWLGRTLIIGGIGYLVSTVVKYLGISGSWTGLLTLPATAGEFWMIGYLLLYGIRPGKNKAEVLAQEVN